jgi:UTP--glucose-1-phosphate uridylyltransferase
MAMDTQLLKAIKKLRSRSKDQVVLDHFEKAYRQFSQGETGIIPFKEIQSLKASDLVAYKELGSNLEPLGIKHLNKLAIIKLNGGIGTSMGCKGTKSLINITKDDSFLSLIIKQVKKLRETHKTDTKLILMNSPHTDAETRSYLNNKYDFVKCFQQTMYPRIDTETKEPVIFPDTLKQEWAPSGHGDIYLSLVTSGLLDELLAAGIYYVFVSNSDNLGARIDPKILGYFIENKLDFLMETTPKTKADIKGGTLIRYNDDLTLLERSQVEESHISDFEDIQKFQIFNTNNLWIDLRSVKAKMTNKDLDLPLIVNKKTILGTELVQLESAMGAAIGSFENARSIIVNRDRFLPVKKNSDLLSLRSDLVTKDDEGNVRINQARNPKLLPSIDLSSEYDNYDTFNDSFPYTPSLIDCQSLIINGPILMGDKVVIKGQVSISNEGDEALVVEGVVLENEKQTL